MAAPPDSLERYELVRRIAVGGMAEVYLAKAYGAHGFEKTLAIKRILPHLAEDAAFERRFIAEAKLSVRLAHANIVQIFDFGRVSGSLVLAMEHVDGMDLADLLSRLRARGDELPLGAALYIAVETLRGLDFAHARGVVHRDVSPSNILLSRAGEVKLTDFGIALAVDEARDRTAVQPVIMGKWRYMSPEQARGGAVTPQSDLFSAGVVLYELFTGAKLFPGDEPEDITRNIHTMDIPSALAARPDAPPELDEVLAAALARDPAGRTARAAVMQRALLEIGLQHRILASAQDVADAVADALAAAPAPAPPPPPPGGRADGGRREGGDGAKGIDTLIREQLGGAGGGGVPRAETGSAARQTDRRGAAPGATAAPGRDVTPPDAPDAPDAPTGRRTEPAGSAPGDHDPDGIGHGDGGERGGGDGNGDGGNRDGGDGSSGGEHGARDGHDGSQGLPVPPIRGDGTDVMREHTTIVVRGRDSDGLALWELRTDAAASRPATDRRGSRARSAARTRWLGASAAAAVAVVAATAWTLHVPEPASLALVADAGDRPDPAPAAPPPAAPPAGASPALDAGAPAARLGVTSSPSGARVRIDGAQVPGVTPLTARVAADRPHEVEVALAGHEPARRTVATPPGTLERVHVALAPLPAALSVHTTPAGARVAIDGRRAGVAPLARVAVAPGVHRVTAQLAGHVSASRTVAVGPGQVQAVELSLERAVRHGRLNLFIEGSWADVYWNGKNVARAPVKGLSLPVGRHELELRNPRTGKRRTITVEVPATGVGYASTRL